MADNSQDRTLPATPRKLEKARKDGQTARSRDLGHFAAMAAGGAALVAAAPGVSGWLKDSLAHALSFDASALASPQYMTDRLLELTLRLMWIVLPMGALMMLVAVAGGVATGGWNWTLKVLQPDFSKLDPLSGVMRLFSKAQLIDALKASLLALILGVIGAFYLRAHVDTFTSLIAQPLPAAITQAAGTVMNGLALMLLVLAAFALVDVPLQRHHHAERLKMSFQEVKQEHKESEGNQEIKVKVRARMRDMTRRRMLAAVAQADLVVMNPTHYAVALKYDGASMAAPRVVAKGADLLALKIRDLANAAKVPVLQSPALARALYAHAELDREIPAALFSAVAQVLAWVYQLRSAMAGNTPMPGAVPELHVPAELDPHHPTNVRPESAE